MNSPEFDTGKAAVAALLDMMGEDRSRDGLVDTPARVTRALLEMTAGYKEDPEQILSTTFQVTYNQIVLLKGIQFVSLCEHHLLPFQGIAHVGYVPGERVVGLSKMARLVTCYARRLQVQERLTNEIAEAMQLHLKPKGVGVIVEAHHSCMGCRGVRQPTSKMVTSAMLGSMYEARCRAEFLELIGL
jgi:GTP cyclohydrolase I